MIQWRSCGAALTDDHDDDVLALPDVSILTRKQLGAAESGACTDVIRGGQCLRKAWPVLGQKIAMPFGNVTLPFLCQLDFTVQVGTKKSTNHASPLCIRRLDGRNAGDPAPPRAVPDVQFSRIRFLGCTRIRGAKRSHQAHTLRCLTSVRRGRAIPIRSQPWVNCSQAKLCRFPPRRLRHVNVQRRARSKKRYRARELP